MKINEKVNNVITLAMRGVESTERVIEIPFLMENLPEAGGQKLLDVGCKESCLLVELNKLGFDCSGIDMRDCDFGSDVGGEGGNFGGKFVKGDARNMNMFDDETFDIVITISTIEHIGLVETPYCTDSIEDSDGDIKAVKEMLRVLKRGGLIIITIPYGKGVASLSKWIRFYDKARLDRILGLFNVDKVVHKVHCIEPNNGIHTWPEVGEIQASERWSTWSDVNGAFIASNVCIIGHK